MSRLSWAAVGALTLAIRLALVVDPVHAAAAEAAAVQPAGRASVFVYAFVDQQPAAGVTLSADDAPLGATDARGAVVTALSVGQHELHLARDGVGAVRIPLDVVAREQVQVTVSWFGTRAPVYTIKSSVSGETTVDLAAAPPAARAADTGDAAAADIAAQADAVTPPAAAAVAATETDAAPAGQSSDTQLSGMEVTGQLLRNDDQGAYTEQRRATAQVFETLSAEQISRAGDTDTAQALKRVTGITLVDSRYVYVRGLGERYSSVLLNGAQVPSPDPTRRVVPLDLFPTEILEGVIVQKTYSASTPGDFGGGTIQLRTRGYPDDFFFKVSGKLGYVDGTTGEDGLTYDGGDRDWTGNDDGTRELPGELAGFTRGGRFLREQSPLIPNGATPEQIEGFGESLSRGFTVSEDSIAPDAGLSVAIGDKYKFGDDIAFGWIAALRYTNEWDTSEEKVQSFTPTSAGLERTDFGDQVQTAQQIDASGFFAMGLDLGPNHHIRTASTLLRQTTDEARVFDGVNASEVTRITRLKWEENSLYAHQISGSHSFPELNFLEANWQYTDARARRYSPNERRYRYDLIEDADGPHYEFSTRADNLGIVFGDLDDDSRQWQGSLKLPLAIGEFSVDLTAGIDRLDRHRDSVIRRFSFLTPSGGSIPLDLYELPTLEQILAPDYINPLGFRLFENTRQTDNYFADQQLDAEYVDADMRFGDKFRLALGARRERNEQTVTTFSIASATQDPVVADLDESDTLPAAAFTWTINENSQLRAVFAETRNRPDFRELSPAPFTDPEQDAESFGNPDLESASIKHYDIRYEYYFDGTDLISLALFRKDFDDPIEVLRLPALQTVLTLDNALTATNQGFEVDVYKHLGFFSERSWAGGDWIPWSDMHVGLNYAWIDSEVELDPESGLSQTSQKRELQGQSPYVVNLQLGYTHPENRSAWTLLYNRFGERIAQVGVDGAPDVYEQPFDQLDFQYEHVLGDSWRWKVRLRNLLDPEVEYHQGDETTRSFRRGREISLILEWQPGGTP